MFEVNLPQTSVTICCCATGLDGGPCAAETRRFGIDVRATAKRPKPTARSAILPNAFTDPSFGCCEKHNCHKFVGNASQNHFYLGKGETIPTVSDKKTNLR
jgi:hypothetical protein